MLFIWVSKLEILWLVVFFVWWKAKVLQALNFEIKKWERVVIAVFVLIWSWLNLMCRIKSNSKWTGSYLVLCYSAHFHTGCLIHSFIQALPFMLFLCKYFLSKTHTLMHRRGHQSITGFTHRDRQLFMFTHTALKKKKHAVMEIKCFYFTTFWKLTHSLKHYQKPYSSNGALQRFSLN